MRIIKSNKLSDIVEVNRRSVVSRTDIRIIELSSLSDLIPSEEAEEMREAWRDHKIKIKQLTNQIRFEPWTDIEGFIEHSLEVRQVTPAILPIKAEVLVFEDVVAFYKVQPTVNILIVEDVDFANQQRALFDAIWNQSQPIELYEDGSTRA